MTERDQPRFSERPRTARRGGAGSGPRPVGDLLLPSLARLGLRGPALEAQVKAAWPEAVGAAVARETHCASFARGRLTVESSSPALSHQLTIQKQTIIDALNSRLGGALVRDVRYRLLPSPPGEKSPTVTPRRRPRDPAP